MTSQDPFRLKKVCANCPFRADENFQGLQPERVSDIAQSLRDGASFHCHATLDYNRAEQTGDDDEPLSPVVKKSQFCAGALATMEKSGEVNQIVQIAERLGLYDPESFDWKNQPVFDSLDEWEAALVQRAIDERTARRSRL